MKHSGFTLIELVVVILIIGVLAAISIPKFLSATGQARTSELPGGMRTIMFAEDIYHSETDTFIACPWIDANNDNVNDNFNELLGIKIVGTYFHYGTSLDGDGYQAEGWIGKSFGGLALNTKVSISEDHIYTYEGDSDDIARLKSYSRAFLR